MTAKSNRLWLWFSAVLAVVCSCAVVAWGCFSDIEMPTSQPPPPTVKPDSQPENEDRSNIDLQNPCWQLSLASSSHEETEAESRPIEQPQVELPRQGMRLRFQLLGVVTEQGKAQAIVSDSEHRIDIRASGESLDLDPAGAVIEEIQNNNVVISFDGTKQSFLLGE